MRNLSEHEKTSSSLWISLVPHFFLLLFAPASFSPSCWEAYQAGVLSAASRAEMADVEQMKKMIPFVTCEITFGQNICELMFGVNVSIILSNKQSKATLWVLDTCLIVELRPLIIILITASVSSKTYNTALEPERMCSA